MTMMLAEVNSISGVGNVVPGCCERVVGKLGLPLPLPWLMEVSAKKVKWISESKILQRCTVYVDRIEICPYTVEKINRETLQTSPIAFTPLTAGKNDLAAS